MAAQHSTYFPELTPPNHLRILGGGSGWENEMSETKIGTVTHYYGKLQVAGVMITDDELRMGDTIHIKGATSDFDQKVESMQIDHKTVDVAKPGDQIGLFVVKHAREHDDIYRVH